MICRDPCVGAAGQTAPTNGLQPPLKTIFDVVLEIRMLHVFSINLVKLTAQTQKKTIVILGLIEYAYELWQEIEISGQK